jgi:hypothetical protein
MDVDEFRRKFRVLDQMLSQHGDMRDRYRALATGLTLLIMFFSILALMFALVANEEDVTLLGITWAGYKWLAVLAGVTFFLSVVDLVVDWPRKAWAHDDATKRLGELKSKFRRARVEDGVDAHGLDLDQEYDATMAVLVEIPNKRFNSLKARHRRKIAISTMLDDHPGAPVRYLRWRLFCSGVNDVRGARGSGVLEESPPTSEVHPEPPPTTEAEEREAHAEAAQHDDGREPPPDGDVNPPAAT